MTMEMDQETNTTKKMEKVDYQKIFSMLIEKVGVTVDELRSRSHIQRIADARSMVAAALIAMPEIRQVDIAALLGTSQAAVSKMLNRHKLYMYYSDYRHRWESLNN